MSLNAATIEFLLGKGLSGDDLLQVARLSEQRRDPGAADRMAKMRSRRKAGVTRNVTHEPLIEELHNPVSEAKASSTIWSCPPNVDPKHWADFRKNRKAKRCTDSETAYEAVLRDLAKLSDDEWPPGQLVRYAAEKGWASINDPRKPLNGHANGQQHHTHLGKSAAAFAALNPSAAEPF